MSSSIDSTNSMLFKLLFKFFEECVIKSPKRFNEFETSESRIHGRVYVACKNGTASISELIGVCSESFRDDMTLPAEVRIYDMKTTLSFSNKTILETYLREEFLANYEETNKYILNLAGKPYINAGDEDNTDPVFLVKGKDTDILGEDIYLHDISNTEHPATYSYYLKQEVSDGISMYKEAYPGVKYLLFMADPVPIEVSRESSDYAILAHSDTIFSDNYTQDVLDAYYASLTYLMAVMRSEYIAESEYYDEYVFTILLLIVISKLLTNVFDQLIEGRIEAPDIRSMYLDSYNCGYFISKMSSDMVDIIIRSLPVLNNIKGSDKVLEYILQLAGIKTSDMKQHYIVKSYTRAEDAIEHSYDNSPDETYDLKVIAVPFGEDPSVYANNLSSIVVEDYKYFVSSDNTWGGPRAEDKIALEKQIKQLKMNYMLTKYISVEYEFNDVSIGYKFSMFFTSLCNILGNSSTTSFHKASFVNTSLKSNGDLITLPSAIGAMLYLLNIYSGGDGTIHRNASTHVYGINTNATINELKKIIVPNTVFGDISAYEILDEGQRNLVNSIIESISSPIESVSEFGDMYVSAMDGYNTLKSISRYSSSKMIHDALYLVGEYLFTVPTNNSLFASYLSYSDYLADVDFNLQDTIINVISDPQVPDYETIAVYVEILMESIIATLRNSEFTSFGGAISLSNAQTTESTGTNTFDEGVLTLLEYFKSYKLTVRTVRPLFSLTDETRDYLFMYTDAALVGKCEINEIFQYTEEMSMYSTIDAASTVNCRDLMKVLTKSLEYHDDYTSEDTRRLVSDNISIKGNMDMLDFAIVDETIHIEPAKMEMQDRVQVWDSIEIIAK